MNTLVKRIKNLTEVELRQAFNEVIEYNKKGFLKEDTLIRQVRNEFAKEMNSESWDMTCIFTSNEIMFEIAKRHYGVND